MWQTINCNMLTKDSAGVKVKEDKSTDMITMIKDSEEPSNLDLEE